jgi:large conductance mechanosensitive channel
LGLWRAIVGSLVSDLINPIISLFMGGVDFSGMYALLGEGEYTSMAEAEEAGAVVFAYGRFIMAIINFLIIAFVVFMLVKSVNATNKKEAPAAPPAPKGPTQEELLMEIRDALKK